MSASKHLEKISAALLDGERVQASVEGTITTTPTSTSGTVRGVLALTDRRFLFSGKAWGASGSRTFPLSTVTSIDLHKNLMLAYVQVTLAGGSERFLVRYKDAEPFIQVAHRVLAELQSAPAAPAAVSVADELAKFAVLHSQGVLSDDEFSAKKAELLAR
jgi:hypothetical protein